MTIRFALSRRQRVMLDYIKEYRRVHGLTPSMRELCAACEISSTSVAAYNLRALVTAGHLKHVGSGTSRAWVPVDEVRTYGED